MHHQFKELAGVDITAEPMEVGPTTHYVMGGVSVDGDSQMTTVDGLFACGEVAAGLHGANRLGGNSLSDLVVFGQRAGEYAAIYAKEHGAVTLDRAQVEEAEREALAPFERSSKENAFNIQADLQEMMQDLVGIVRVESEVQQAVERLAGFWERASAVGCPSNREYNPGWHTALDLQNLLTVSQAAALSALDRKESRGAHFRDDYPAKDEAYSKHNTYIRKGPDGEMQLTREPIVEMRDELKEIIAQEQKA
jgi:succinate dehydrogenase / fumarate reductase flavoprotein subunit